MNSTVSLIEVAPTLDLSNLCTILLVRMAEDLLTSTIILTVGRVVAMFWGCGGRMVTGTQPTYKHP